MNGFKRKGNDPVERNTVRRTSLCWVLIFALVFSIPAVGPSEAFAEAVSATGTSAGDTWIDFENYAVGPLNGQHGWTNATSQVAVTDQVYATSGSKTVKITDTDKTKAERATYNFSQIRKGSVEWRARAEKAGRLIVQLQESVTGTAKPVEWIGFLGNGRIEYFDGATRLYSGKTYETGKWYRFRVDFDGATGKKTIYVFDDNNLIVWAKNTSFRDTSATSVDLIRLDTIVADIGTFYVDDIRIHDAMQDGEGTLQSLVLYPKRSNLSVGQTEQMVLFGNDSNGNIHFVGDDAAYASSHPEVASVDRGAVTGISPGTTVIAATYAGLRATANVSVFDANDVPPYKDLPPRPLERTTDVSGLQIVVPDNQDWEALVYTIANELLSRWNVRANVVAPDPAQFGSGWSGNVLIVGNLANNEQMARLYGLRMSYADAVYPGNGGYQLLTVVDPFGKGGNTIVLGASDPDGAQLGVDRLLQVLRAQDNPVLPWMAEAKLSVSTATSIPYEGNPTDADIAAGLATADVWLAALKPTSGNETDANALLNVLAKTRTYGEYYQLTGHPGFGQIYRKLLKGYANFLNLHPIEAKAQLNGMRNMWVDGDKLVENWTVLEASPLFAETDREQIVSALNLTFEANARDNWLLGAAPNGPRGNHQIFPALSLVVAADYFERYHDLPEAPGWRQLGERIFSGNTSFITSDEGSEYLMHVPITFIDYAMAVGDEQYMSRSLRPNADLNAMMIDNLGVMTGGGDIYPFGASSAYAWGHSQVMHAASWYYGDPLYHVLLERTRTGPFPGQSMPDLTYPIHRYMALPADETAEFPEDHYPKLQALPVEQGLYDDLREKEQAELDVAQPDAFHKMTFRQGFGVDDGYLAVDGFSAGGHGHQDGNAILEYSANGRIFLADRDYIENTPEHHSGLVIVKDGEQRKKPPLAKLEWAADIDGTGISRSLVPNYNGTDWTRSIVSPDGQFYIIYDDVSFNESGDYLLKNLWQSLGNAQIRDDRFEVEQQGVTMTLQNMDGSDLRLQDRYGHFMKYWKKIYPYPYADRETVLGGIKQERTYQAGDQTGFIHVLSSHQADEPAVRTQRLNETTLQIRKGSEEWLAASGPHHTDVLQSNGTFHLIGDRQLLSAGVTEVQVGAETLHFAKPVLFKLDTTSGEWETYSLRKDRLHYDANNNPIREGAVDSGTVPWTVQKQHKLEQAVSGTDHSGQQAPPAPPSPSLSSSWQQAYAFAGEVTDAVWGDLDGDGMDELVLGGSEGAVQAVDSAGHARWSFTATGRINEVTVQSLDGRPVVFVATEDWYVYALDAQGREMWRYRFPYDAAHREQKGNLLGITNVRVAYANGAEQDLWIMVGTQFRYLYGLDRNGQLQYNIPLYYYGIEDMEFADFDGDGKEEGMMGMEYTYFNFWNDQTYIRDGADGGPGWKVVDAMKQGSGDGKPAAIIGTKQNEVRLVQYDNGLKVRWKRNVGGEVNDIRHGDFNNDGVAEILAGTDGFQFYALNPDGTVRFRQTLGDRVLKVNGWERDGQTRYLAAADRGKLYVLSDQGEIVQTHQFPQNIVEISVSGGSEEARVVLENGEVYTYSDSPPTVPEILGSMNEYIDRSDKIDRTFAGELSYRLTIIQLLLDQEADGQASAYMQDFIDHINDSAVLNQQLISAEDVLLLEAKARTFLESVNIV